MERDFLIVLTKNSASSSVLYNAKDALALELLVHALTVGSNDDQFEWQFPDYPIRMPSHVGVHF